MVQHWLLGRVHDGVGGQLRRLADWRARLGFLQRDTGWDVAFSVPGVLVDLAPRYSLLGDAFVEFGRIGRLMQDIVRKAWLRLILV